ncbi:MAG: DUF3788 family protein [Thermoanaerobaculia bacterium]|jgi:hypothetical protein|nr:DUF3788 family protein [Thermoanaerobaculia bacterium]
MSLSVFDDPGQPPGPAVLRRRLGPAATAWKALVDGVAERCGPVEELWSFGGAKFGWSLRLLRKGRVLLYLTPQEGRLLAGLVLGGKAVAAAREAGLPPALLAQVEAAPQYAEGRGLRVEVSGPDGVEGLLLLVGLKADPSVAPSVTAASPSRAARPRGGGGIRRGGR